MPISNIKGLKPNQYSFFKDFQDTKLPIFKVAEEPLQADEWLNTIKQKCYLLRVTEHQKADICVPSTIGTSQNMVDPFPVLSTYEHIGHMGAVQVSL